MDLHYVNFMLGDELRAVLNAIAIFIKSATWIMVLFAITNTVRREK